MSHSHTSSGKLRRPDNGVDIRCAHYQTGHYHLIPSKQSAKLSNLSTELVLSIVSYHTFHPQSRRSTLASLCLTCRNLARICQELLYRTVDISPGTPENSSWVLYQLLRSLLYGNPRLAFYVRELRISLNFPDGIINPPYQDLYLSRITDVLNLSTQIKSELGLSHPYFRNHTPAELYGVVLHVLVLLLPVITTLTIRDGHQLYGYNKIFGFQTLDPFISLHSFRHLRHVTLIYSTVSMRDEAFGELNYVQLVFNHRTLLTLDSLTMEMRPATWEFEMDLADCNYRNRRLQLKTHFPSLALESSGPMSMSYTFSHMGTWLKVFELLVVDAYEFSDIRSGLLFHAGTLEVLHLGIYCPRSEEMIASPIGNLQGLYKLKELRISEAVAFGRWICEKHCSDLHEDFEHEPHEFLVDFLPDALERLTIDVGQIWPRSIFTWKGVTNPLLHRAERLPRGLTHVRLAACTMNRLDMGSRGVTERNFTWYISPPIPLQRKALETFRLFFQWKVNVYWTLLDGCRENATRRLFMDMATRNTWDVDCDLAKHGIASFEDFEAAYEAEFRAKCFGTLEVLHEKRE